MPVIVRFDEDGELRPLEIEYEDGDGKRRFVVDRVLDVRRAACESVGGVGDRYTVMIRGKETYLWFEKHRWFVTGKRV